MPIYRKEGVLPAKQNAIFRTPNENLYHKELFGISGFSGLSSLVYHLNPPNILKSNGAPYAVKPKIAVYDNLHARSFQSFKTTPSDDYIDSRKMLFVNTDMSIGIAAPSKSMTGYFYKNADADELFFVHNGSGTLKTMYGKIPFEYGDYIFVPRGTVYQFKFDTADNHLLLVESEGPIQIPTTYHNAYGQFIEHSPFYEHNFKFPIHLKTHNEVGEFLINIKKLGLIYPYIQSKHPFDVVGWNGSIYPYAFSIFNFEPVTANVAMQPTIHQTFQGRNFDICSFVPHTFGYKPNGIPSNYNHRNLYSDALLYYVDGNIMSHNSKEKGLFSIHPGGLTHSIHPEPIERNMGNILTKELAVMIDTFNPIMITEYAINMEFT